MKRIWTWIGWLVLPLCLSAPAPAGEATVPLTKVTSYSSGVAYFEHNGTVTDDAEVLLKFKTEQINDILKSLVVMDFDGGDVAGVSYASREPLTRALKSFGVDLSGEPTLGQLLRQLRGAEVTVSAPAKIRGKILGVQTKTTHLVDSNALVRRDVLNLLTAEGIKSIDLETVAAIALADERLAGELNKALALLVDSRDTTRKPVQIRFTGKGKRRVRIGYIAEAPIWKTSYRLVLGGQKEGEALLQGWAIVENTSDFDWEKVSLTLVSGRPISFVQDLYTPLYVPRPVVRPELYASLRPRVYEEGLKRDREMPELAARGLRRAAKKAKGVGAYRLAAPGAPAPAPRAGRSGGVTADAMTLAHGVRAAAAGAAVGELFSYRIKTPVSLRRRTSAMLPIINQPVKARKVSIYNASVQAAHPLNGLWLVNDTHLSLLGGPVTVFDGGTYAGDARIGNLSPDEKRLLSYALDLKVTVDSSARSSQRITSARIVRGVLTVTRRREYSREYVIKNKAEEKRTLVVEHPRDSRRKLVEPAEPAEQTASLYRFEVEVPASKTSRFRVLEEQTVSQTVAILPSSVGSLQYYARSGEIPRKVREALSEAIRRKQALAEAERRQRELQMRIDRLRREQSQVRANLTAVARGSQAYQRFEAKLLDLEDRIEQLQKASEAQRDKVEGLRKDLEDYLGKLKV